MKVMLKSRQNPLEWQKFALIENSIKDVITVIECNSESAKRTEEYFEKKGFIVFTDEYPEHFEVKIVREKG